MKHTLFAVAFTLVTILSFAQTSEPEAFYTYLSENIMIPRKAHNANVDGRFFVKFKAAADGVITDISIPKKLGAGYDEEATKAIAATPPDIVIDLVAKTGASDFVATIRFDVNGISSHHIERAYSDKEFYALREVIITKVRPKEKKK